MRDVLYQLELSLLTQAARQSPEALDKLLSEEFIEFGSSGNIYTKKDCVESLPLEPHVNGTIKDFSVTKLSQDVMLVTYKATIDNVMSLRSSVWKNNSHGWQMVFHQGTLLNSTHK